MIKFYKFGMGKVAEQVSAFVRDEELSNEAKKLVDSLMENVQRFILKSFGIFY